MAGYTAHGSDLTQIACAIALPFLIFFEWL